MPPKNLKVREQQAYEMGLRCGRNNESRTKYEPALGKDKILRRWFTIGLMDAINERKESK